MAHVEYGDRRESFDEFLSADTHFQVVKRDIAEIKAHLKELNLDSVASKEDIFKLEARLIKWLIPTERHNKQKRLRRNKSEIARLEAKLRYNEKALEYLIKRKTNEFNNQQPVTPPEPPEPTPQPVIPHLYLGQR